MLKLWLALIVSLAALPALAATPASSSLEAISFVSIDGKPMPLDAFKGKALLIVNTASQCGFTPQYSGLQKLWETYRDKGLVLIGVPSNDFGGQEPGSASAIKDFCETTFGIDFPMTDKVVVRGPAAHPFFQWAKASLGDPGVPRWNFHKILIGADGKPVAGFPSRIAPDDKNLTKAIEAALPKS